MTYFFWRETRQLIGLRRDVVRLTAGLLTWYSTLRSHLILIGVVEGSRCRKCWPWKRKSSILCDALAGIRNRVLCRTNLDVANIREAWGSAAFVFKSRLSVSCWLMTRGYREPCLYEVSFVFCSLTLVVKKYKLSPTSREHTRLKKLYSWLCTKRTQHDDSRGWSSLLWHGERSWSSPLSELMSRT